MAVGHVLPDGRELFADVSFRVGEGARVALVGPNGAGKTTLLRMVAGEIAPAAGSIARSGGLGVMSQFVGAPTADDRTLADLALSLAPPAGPSGRRSGCGPPRRALDDTERTQVRYADALVAWGEAGGYAAEVAFDTASVAVLGLPWDEARHRRITTLSGGEQKRFALELLLRGPDEVLLLDEPDNYLDVPGKRWLEARLGSHRRACCTSATTASCSPARPSRWSPWRRARPGPTRRASRPGTRRGWPATPASTSCAAAGTRSGPSWSAWSSTTRSRRPTTTAWRRGCRPRAPGWRSSWRPGRRRRRPREQSIRMQLGGARTGKRAVVCEQLELDGLTYPFDLEVWFGDRVAVLGAQRHRQVALPAAAGPRRHRPGAGRGARERRGARSRSRTAAWRGWAPGCGPGTSRRPTTVPS